MLLSDGPSSLLLTPVAARQPQPGRLPQLLKALVDPTRMRIVGLLAQRELCVCDLDTLFGISHSMISQHLGVLRRTGLLLQRREERDARWVYYRLNPQTTAAVVKQLASLLDLSSFDDTPARCD